MADLASPEFTEHLRILDPGAGMGILACALCESLALRYPALRSIDLITYELDPTLEPLLRCSLDALQRWLKSRQIDLRYVIYLKDFVLDCAGVLHRSIRLFDDEKLPGDRDIVIMNPPYFKVAKSDPRACAVASIVYGQPNIFSFFMALGAAMLRPGGEYISITPRSFAAGAYFQRFREYFFASMRPTHIHLFESRTEAFGKDEVLQENIIMRALNSPANNQGHHTVAISWSTGIADLAQRSQRPVPYEDMLDQRRVFHIPARVDDDRVRQRVLSWPGSLHAYGWQISTGPVVAFRARSYLTEQYIDALQTAPFLWMHNVIPMHIQWPHLVKGKAQQIMLDAPSPLLVPNKTCVLLRRFSPKESQRRIIAAPYLKGSLVSSVLGLENHLNYVYAPGGEMTTAEATGLAALLNSQLIDRYIRLFNGNTQVNAVEFRALPLPPLEQIRSLGEKIIALDKTFTLEQLDDLIDFLIH